MRDLIDGPQKVVLLSFDFHEYCLRLADALSEHLEVVLLLPEQPNGPPCQLLETVRCDVRLFHKPRLREPRRQLAMITSLVRTIRGVDPDLLHIQQGHAWFNGVLPLLGAYPLVLTVHDPRHHVGDREGQKHPQIIYDFGFRRASSLIAHSQTLKQEVVDRLGYPASQVHVVPHIRLGQEVAPETAISDEPIVLFFGRIWEYKGLEYLIKAQTMINDSVPDARIVIAGRGENFDRYRRMMADPERFTVINRYVPDDERAELFRSAAVVVLPYIDASQSGVIPLAYASSKPVVATMVGGLPEFVDDGRTGYLVPPRDEQALANAVIDLLRNPMRRREFGQNGKKKLDAECSEEIISEKTYSVYAAALR